MNRSDTPHETAEALDVVGDLPVEPGPADALRASAERAADMLRSIGSAHRLIILCMLTDGPRSVSEICAATGMRQSLASQHLSRLRLDKLVTAERQGHFVHYSLSHPAAKEIIEVLYRHFCAPGATP
jgi:ArsR family transcriptional regulator, virulence genes transcriptional regulator